MIWLLGAIATLLLFLGTFGLFIAIMRLRDMRDSGELAKLHWSVTWAAYALLNIGLVFDMLLNLVPMSVLFFELPHIRFALRFWYWLPYPHPTELELLVTGRVRRHKKHSTGWRNTQALWWCRNWLTPFDRKHCE